MLSSQFNALDDIRADIEEELISQEVLQAKVAELARQIIQDYKDKDLLIVGALKGAVLFMADLIRHIPFPLNIDFMAISSYGISTNSSGIVRILKDLDHSIEGRDVLLIEDIVDSGLTLGYISEHLKARNPASFKICALLNKPSRRSNDLEIDYLGFDIPDKFVVGYGLDFAEKYRNLPFIGVLKPEKYS